MSNPVLVELTRGRLVESVHTGAFTIVAANGEAIAAVGDVARPVFPRSAIKAFQTLAMIETGAADRYGFGPAEIALACASHSGTETHVAVAKAMLAVAGQDAAALACGAHDPVYEPAARALFKAGQTPTRLHNNCSGKHAGMIAACVHCGEPVATYAEPGHPHQRRIARILADFTGAAIDDRVAGIDGCSAPNWAIPIASLAQVFARFVTGDRLAPARRAACERIAAACAAKPELVAGPGRLDTVAMQRLGRRLFMKTGAEGVYCGALATSGLGFAVKIDDGSKRASEAVVQALIARVFPGELDFPALGPLRNYAGLDIGTTRTAPALDRVLERLHGI